MRALIHLVQDEVWAAFGQRLEPEIEFIGDWSRPGSWVTEGVGSNRRYNAAVDRKESMSQHPLQKRIEWRFFGGCSGEHEVSLASGAIRRAP